MSNVHDFSRFRDVRSTLPIPAALEAEQAVLGAILLHNGSLAAVAQHVDLVDFGEPLHQRIYDVASQLIAAGKPASPITLKTFLGDAELADGVTMSMYLARLAAGALPPSEAPGMAKHVRSIAARRRLIEAASALDQRARDVAVRDDAAEIAGSAMIELQKIAAAAGTDTARPIADFADRLMAEVEDVLSGEVASRVVTTGYADLDRAINGLEPGTIVVIAGRPGMCKTGVANSIGNRCARTGVGVLEFPAEVGPEQMVARHLSDLAFRGSGKSAAYRDIGQRAKELPEDQIAAVRQAHVRLRELPIIVDNRSRISVPQIASKIAQTKRDMRARGIQLGVAIVDHLDFVCDSGRYKGLRTQEIAEIMIGLKEIARSQDICLILLSQLSREVEKRPAKERRPMLSDLRNSGDIEQVADVVIFVYREEYYATRSAEFLNGDADAFEAALAARGKMELIVAKNRAGPTPTVHVFCDPACSSVSSYERGCP